MQLLTRMTTKIMNNYVNKYMIFVRTITLGVVCLFTMNTILWAAPVYSREPQVNTLAAESRFTGPVSIRTQAEILEGIEFLRAGKTYSTVNGMLLAKGNSNIEFLSGIERDVEGKNVKARFVVKGHENDIVEVEYNEDAVDLIKTEPFDLRLKEQKDLLNIYNEVRFAHTGFNEKITFASELYGDIEYTTLNPSEQSTDIKIKKDKRKIVGSKYFGLCIGCALSWTKDGEKYIWLGHFYPPRAQQYDFFLKEKIQSLVVNGVDAKDIKLVAHTSLEGKQKIEKENYMDVDSKVFSEELGLSIENIVINIKTKSPAGYVPENSEAPLSNLIVSDEGVTINYRQLDGHKQVILWNTMETWMEPELFRENNEREIIDTNSQVKMIGAENNEREKILHFLQNTSLADGHVHFGGLIDPEDLWQMALERKDIDWSETSAKISNVLGIKSIVGDKIDLNSILDEARGILRESNILDAGKDRLEYLKASFKAITQYKPVGKGNLGEYLNIYQVASVLSRGDPDVIKDIIKRIILRKQEEGLGLIEFRMRIASGENRAEMYENTLERIEALIEGIKESQENTAIDADIVMSVMKMKDIGFIVEQISVLLDILEDHPELRKHVTGFDVGGPEQINVPSQFVKIYEKIGEYNKRRQEDRAPLLGLTFHAGEDFETISIESAIRQVHEVMDLGVDRIGHGLVLGFDTRQFEGTVRKEHISDRIAQIYYDLKTLISDAKGLDSVGLRIDRSELLSELEKYRTRYEDIRALFPEPGMFHEILGQNGRGREEEFFEILHSMKKSPRWKDEHVDVEYDGLRCEELEKRQNYVLNKIIEKDIVIEVNPTSNVSIGPIDGYAKHPIRKFLDYTYSGRSSFIGKKPIVIVGTDNPGIFGITLIDEYMKLVDSVGLTMSDVKQLADNGFKYRLGKRGFRSQIEQLQWRNVFQEGDEVLISKKMQSRSTVIANNNLDKQNTSFQGFLNWMRYVLVRSARYLDGHPVNMYIDLTAIQNEPGQLKENIKTLSRLIAWQNTFGLDLRYILDGDNEGTALGLLKKELYELGEMPDVDSLKLIRSIGSPHTGDKAIDIKLENLSGDNKARKIRDREYVVGLKDEGTLSGISVPNYTAASVIGLSLAALRVASDRAEQQDSDKREYEQFRDKMLDKIREIYQRYEIIEKKTDFSEEELEMMVTGTSATKLYFTFLYALPPAVKVIEEIHKYHEMMRDVLIAA